METSKEESIVSLLVHAGANVNAATEVSLAVVKIIRAAQDCSVRADSAPLRN